MERSDARFQLKDARITRVFERPKVCFLTVMCTDGKYPSYYDVTVFTPPDFALEEGLAVTISGSLSKQKPKEGEKEWKVQLIARKIEQGDEAAAPRPKNSSAPSRPRHVDINADDDMPF